MLLERLKDLRMILRDWLVYREIISLSNRADFKRVRPSSVLKILQEFLGSKFIQRSKVDSSSSELDPHVIECRQALLRIWESARNETKSSETLRFQWHRVMASCNAVYGILASDEPERGLARVAINDRDSSQKASRTSL